MTNELINIPNGILFYQADFLGEEAADALFEELLHTVEWKQESMKIYGKEVLFPRLTAYMGDVDYAYSGKVYRPDPWTPSLLDVKRRVEAIGDTTFNSVLLNRYRDGNDSMGWHADNEKELGRNPVIASINLGAERDFQLRHNITKEKRNILLEHGSLLIMGGELQHHWKHQVPKRKRVMEERVNLTYRLVRS